MSGDKLILEGVIGDEKLYRAKIEPLSKAIDENKKSPSYITTAAAKSQPVRSTRTLSC